MADLVSMSLGYLSLGNILLQADDNISKNDTSEQESEDTNVNKGIKDEKAETLEDDKNVQDVTAEEIWHGAFIQSTLLNTYIKFDILLARCCTRF